LIAILAIVFNKIMDYLGIYSIKDCGKKSWKSFQKAL
jgi:hypothetical protein